MAVVFGGKERKTSTGGTVQLPEQIRAQQCTHDKCKECGSRSNCFGSSDGERGKYNRWGAVTTLSVDAGLSFTSYRASAYAKCDTGDVAKLKVLLREMRNGELKVFKDGIHKKTFTKEGSVRAEHGVLGEWYEDHRGHGEAFELSVEFFPRNPKETSKATLAVEMDDVRPQFEQCMDHKACLAAMGSMQDEASYALRNKNKYQLTCLKRGTLPSFGGKMAPVCEAWRTCVEKTPDLSQFLTTSLSAANPSLLQAEVTAVAKASRPQDECLDPSIADIEAFECECMVELHEQCGDEEECFKSWFCNRNEVCRDWKVANACPGHLLQTERGEAVEAEAKRHSPKAHMALAAKQRPHKTENSSSLRSSDSLLERRSGSRRSMTVKSDGSMDDSLAGKCTTSTRF
jgi:hypothetical protein